MQHPELYLVHIWHGQPRFRASARRVDDDTARCFGSVDELTRYLAAPPAHDNQAPPSADAQATDPRGGTP